MRAVRQPNAIVRSGVVAEVIRLLRHLGAPVRPTLEAAGLDPASDFEDPLAAVPLAVAVRLFDLAAKASGRADFAILYTKGFRTQASGLFGDILRSAATVREMFDALSAYFPIYSLHMETTFAVDDGVGRVSWNYPAGITGSHVQYNLFLAAAMVERARRTVPQTPHWVPLTVQFDHVAPDCPDALRAMFGGRVRFGTDANAITVDAAKLAMPLVSANPSRFAHSVDLARRWMEEMQLETDTAAQAQKIIENLLGEEPTDLESVATALGLSARALQWRLGRAGTTFEHLLSDARRGLAERLLVTTDRPLTQISFDLGFSNPSAFTRAAQRWFGMSPRQVRHAARGSSVPPKRPKVRDAAAPGARASETPAAGSRQRASGAGGSTVGSARNARRARE